jgi:SAM-dependent methyltransferase
MAAAMTDRTTGAAGAYGQAADRWARGATLVYGPLADALLDLVGPDEWRGRRTLDVGAGTGVASARLADRGATTIATDLAEDMLRVAQLNRPPALVADGRRLALRTQAFDAVVASFVLNHLTDPVRGLVELRRVARPDALLVASVFSTRSSHPGRDLIDDVATRWGWEAPDWYTTMKVDAVPLLASVPDMTIAAEAAGLVVRTVDERAVDVGVTRADELVAYRLGQAHIAEFLGGLSPADQQALAEEATVAVGEPMEPYRPIVVFLAASIPAG